MFEKIAASSGRTAPVLAVLLWMAPCGLARAQTSFFVPTNGPGGGAVDDLAYAPDGDLFALAGGVYRSADGGASWAPTLQPPGPIVGLVVDPSGRILVVGQDRPLRSRDDGATWDPLAPPSGTLGILAFGAGGRIFAGTTTGLFRSVDDGLSWTRLDVP